MTLNKIKYILHSLSIGAVGILWEDEDTPRLIRIIVPVERFSSQLQIKRYFPDADPGHHIFLETVCRLLDEYDQGLNSINPIHELLPNYADCFSKRVWLATSAIPGGKVNTYGQIAEKILSPGAARAVGNALGKNPFPLIVPCHRVIRANGELGGFSGGGIATKRRLLEREGIVFDRRGRVIL